LKKLTPLMAKIRSIRAPIIIKLIDNI